MKTILLASTSPRRARLLAQCGIPHEVTPVDDGGVEAALDISGLPPERVAESAAQAKMDHARTFLKQGNSIILCADTIVVAGEDVLGKPEDAEHARRMLRRLSGTAHEVITGVALHDNDTGVEALFHERTEVVFRELDRGEIDRYAHCGEPLDKAGAYGIQGKAGAFVSGVRGCYSNVVGLPMSRLAAVLKHTFRMDITGAWPHSP